ncbi:MAG: YgeY family selenium metabolism-linked hydrolase [Bacteroidales bacterium]
MEKDMVIFTVQNLSGMDMSSVLTDSIRQEIVSFAQDLVRIKSYSGGEKEIIIFIAEKMKRLGYDKVNIDSMGNLLGIVGDGPESILFDSHVDTVTSDDAGEWDIPPFSGEIKNGMLHGRGSVDMKSSVAATVYAGALAARAGLISGKTIYVSCTVYEEDCDGVNLRHLFKEFNIKPGAVIICEPSDNRISLGHKGKAQVTIKAKGVPAHGSAPEKGINAIYEMAEIIGRVEQLNRDLAGKEGAGPTVVMSRISSKSASLNAVPSECEAYLDRRMVPGESEDDIRREMDALVSGKNAGWAIDTIIRRSYTGLEISYKPFHPAWEIGMDHPLTEKCIRAYRDTFGNEPDDFEFWDFSTNAVTPVSMGIPTIGFGPGDYKLAHMRNEMCSVDQITDACRLYINLIAC